jgi:hypothetical protein
MRELLQNNNQCENTISDAMKLDTVVCLPWHSKYATLEHIAKLSKPLLEVFITACSLYCVSEFG